MTKISKNKTYSDPIASCKSGPSGYTNSASKCTYYETPDSKLGSGGSHLEDDNGPDSGGRQFAKLNPVAGRNSYTGSGGTTRGSTRDSGSY